MCKNPNVMLDIMLKSERRCRLPLCKHNRYNNSFIPGLSTLLMIEGDEMSWKTGSLWEFISSPDEFILLKSVLMFEIWWTDGLWLSGMCGKTTDKCFTIFFNILFIYFYNFLYCRLSDVIVEAASLCSERISPSKDSWLSRQIRNIF